MIQTHMARKNGAHYSNLLMKGAGDSASKIPALAKREESPRGEAERTRITTAR